MSYILFNSLNTLYLYFFLRNIYNSDFWHFSFKKKKNTYIVDLSQSRRRGCKRDMLWIRFPIKVMKYLILRLKWRLWNRWALPQLNIQCGERKCLNENGSMLEPNRGTVLVGCLAGDKRKDKNLKKTLYSGHAERVQWHITSLFLSNSFFPADLVNKRNYINYSLHSKQSNPNFFTFQCKINGT